MRGYQLETMIQDAFNENVEYAFKNGYISDDENLNELAYEAISETIDGSVIYTSDIISLWQDMGMPEDDDADGDFSITSRMIWGILQSAHEDYFPSIDVAVESILTNYSELTNDNIWESFNDLRFADALTELYENKNEKKN